MTWTKKERRQSFNCNGDLVRGLRQALGWSQADFSKRSGYSERLIYKAESGGRVTLATLEVLSQTLSQGGNGEVTTKDLIADPVRIARLYTEATHGVSNEAFDKIARYLAEDVEMNASGSQCPHAGRYVGVDEFERAFNSFHECVELSQDADLSNDYQYFQDEEVVVVWGKCQLRSEDERPSSPIPLTRRLKFRDGKIFHVEDRVAAKPR